MAKAPDKRIILVSDMYLPANVVNRIVEKSGYHSYVKLYVSSETRVLKNTGDMFTYVVSDLGVQPRKFYT